MALDSTLVTNWKADLNSGTFTQTFYALKTTTGGTKYCALGLLLNRAGQTQAISSLRTIGMSFEAQKAFVDLNDNQHKTFSQIAALVDSTLAANP